MSHTEYIEVTVRKSEDRLSGFMGMRYHATCVLRTCDNTSVGDEFSSRECRAVRKAVKNARKRMAEKTRPQNPPKKYTWTETHGPA